MRPQATIRAATALLFVGLLGCSDGGASSSSTQGAGGANAGVTTGSGAMGGASSTSSTGGGGASAGPSHCYDGFPTAVAEDAGLRLQTPHYSVYSELGSEEGDVVARLLEASYSAMTAYFDVPPPDDGQRLQCKIYATEAAWQAGMVKDGVTMPPNQAGGYFDPGTRTAYLYRQPTTYYTRVLAVHEVVHQFHLLGRAADAGPLPSWYVEGIAEHLSRHDWDGRCVRLGILPLLSQTDMPKKARDEVAQGGLDLSELLNADPGSRPRAWATVSYFRLAQGGALQEKFRAFETLLEAGPKATAFQIFSNAIGPPADFDAPIKEWLEQNQQPLQPVFLEWIHQGPTALRGFATGVLSLARVKAATTSLGVSYGPDGEVGALLGFDDSGQFDAVVRRKDGSLQMFTTQGGSATWSASLGNVPAAQSYTLSVQRTGPQTVNLSINDQSLTINHQFSASLGLAIHDSTVDFSSLSFQ